MRWARELAIMAPHSGIGGGGPRPRKLSPEPIKIASASEVVACTMMRDPILGMM